MYCNVLIHNIACLIHTVTCHCVVVLHNTKIPNCIDTLDTCKYFNTCDIVHASSTLFRLLLLLNTKDYFVQQSLFFVILTFRSFPMVTLSITEYYKPFYCKGVNFWVSRGLSSVLSSGVVVWVRFNGPGLEGPGVILQLG